MSRADGLDTGHLAPEALMGFYFAPRGGSSHVARALCRSLSGGPWQPRLVTGSLGGQHDPSNAHRFFDEIPCDTVDYTEARAVWDAGDDPMAAAVPMHASYESKADVPDRIFFELDDTAFDLQTQSWLTALGDGPAPPLMHLHHLTPLHEAAGLLWPDAPVITHLHGTELSMLAGDGSRPPLFSDGGSAHCHDAWTARMRRWAAGSDRVIVVSDQDAGRAGELLGVADDRITVLPNGVDLDTFSGVPPSDDERATRWTQWLVDEPRGWGPGRDVGSVTYAAAQLDALVDDHGQALPVVLFSGRFTRGKRLGHLIEAHHVLQQEGVDRSILVIAGGFPGEWEGEHPLDTITRLGATGVFLAGWRDHAELSEMLSCSDVFCAPGVDEPFGLVYLEAMAAGLPPIATRTGGPTSFINVDPAQPTGWLVDPDDLPSTVAALRHAIGQPDERRRRGRRAAAHVRDHFSWPSVADRLAAVYEDTCKSPSGRRLSHH